MEARTRGPDGSSHERPSQPSPQIAVITVTYNRAHLLPRAIDSVLSQEYPCLRLIVVDDGSTDDTSALLRELQADPRVDVVRHETNRGVLGARNTALACLREDDVYFCYLDSDDTLLPGAIQTMSAAFSESGDRYSMVLAGSQDRDTGRSDGWHDLDSHIVTYDDVLADRVHGNYMELVRRDLADGLRYDPRAWIGEHVMWAQILKHRPALTIPEVVQLTDHSSVDRISTSTAYDRAHVESVMWTSLYGLRAYGADLRQSYPQRYAAELKDLARVAAIAGDGRRARLASRQAMRVDPTLRTAVVVVAALMPTGVVRGLALLRRRIRSFRAPGAGRRRQRSLRSGQRRS